MGGMGGYGGGYMPQHAMQQQQQQQQQQQGGPPPGMPGFGGFRANSLLAHAYGGPEGQHEYVDYSGYGNGMQ
jgi:hypothetical protein